MSWFNWFSRELKVQPPYDTLSAEQQKALYFLLEYFGKLITNSNTVLHPDAKNFLSKAAWYLGLSKKTIEISRSNHQNVRLLYNTIRTIDNMTIIERMIGNCRSIVILSLNYNQEQAFNAYYSFWENWGYRKDEIDNIVRNNPCRTDI